MAFADIIAKRRTVYALNKDLPVPNSVVEDLVRQMVKLVPDSYNMRSQRAVLVFGGRHDALWDAIHDAFDGKVDRDKIGSFKKAAGTVLFFTDSDVIKRMRQEQPRYADKFALWSQHAMGMLQFAVWTALSERNIGASLQHYNPVIDGAVRELFSIPDSWLLTAQMPFGGIVREPLPKQSEDVSERFKIVR